MGDGAAGLVVPIKYGDITGNVFTCFTTKPAPETHPNSLFLRNNLDYLLHK